MRKLALGGLAAGLAATLASAPRGAWAHAAPSPADPGPPLEATRLDAPPPDRATPNLRDPYPNPPPPEDLAKAQAEAKDQESARPKITGDLVAEAGGGVAGGLLAKGVGTAVAGPVGGFAASWIGSSLGRKAVHAVRRMFRRDRPPPQQAQAAQPPAVDASAAAAGGDRSTTPGPDQP
jgi:predicted lipid-binding transport protein (Tim44 family)